MCWGDRNTYVSLAPPPAAAHSGPSRGNLALPLHCSPSSPPPLTLLIRSPVPPFFQPLPTPSNRSQAPLGLFFFFLNPGCKFLPCQQIDCQIIFLQKEKGGVGGEQEQKGGRTGEGRERDRGGERYPSAELGLAAGGEAGSKVSSAAAGWSSAAAPARVPFPPGRSAPAGAGRPAHCSQPSRRCAADFICALCVCVRLHLL